MMGLLGLPALVRPPAPQTEAVSQLYSSYSQIAYLCRKEGELAISRKTRKILWGRSASRCSYCRCELILGASQSEDESIVGEECHIVSPKPNGPRYDPTLNPDLLDECENLILLCRNHHKMVDDRANEYSSDVLKKLKAWHENWVRDNLRPLSRKRREEDKKLPRITTGRELIAIMTSAELFDFDHDDLSNDEEVSIVGRFLQEAQDWADMGDTLEAYQRVNATHEYTELIKQLDLLGFMVFGTRETRKYKTGDIFGDWSVAVLRVRRSTNPGIQSGPMSRQGI